MMMVIMLLKLAWERMTKAIFYSSSGEMGHQLGLIRAFIKALNFIQSYKESALCPVACPALTWFLLFNKNWKVARQTVLALAPGKAGFWKGSDYSRGHRVGSFVSFAPWSPKAEAPAPVMSSWDLLEPAGSCPWPGAEGLGRELHQGSLYNRLGTEMEGEKLQFLYKMLCVFLALQLPRSCCGDDH